LKVSGLQEFGRRLSRLSLSGTGVETPRSDLARASQWVSAFTPTRRTEDTVKKNRIVLVVAIVSLMSGGFALAADGSAAGDTGPTMDTQGSNILLDDDIETPRQPRFRQKRDQPREVPFEYGDRVPNHCSDSPLAQLLASLYGMDDIMRNCDPTE
jgi:hypothetical protein